jgi:hypothetical protein
MGHIVLLGDSIFDNGAYVPGGPDVVRQLRGRLPHGWKATLLAVDGATARDVPDQLVRLPADATHLAVSAGGNDALMASGLLNVAVRGVGEAVALLAEAQERFASEYREMVAAVAARRLPTALCTIYDTPQTSERQRIVRTALAVFNDVITRAAFSGGLALIDLRLVCSEPEDYANPIEPSAAGGEKISRAILRFALAASGRELPSAFVVQ